MLFDLGLNYHLAPRKLLEITDVVVSHAHMDHFIGFDHLLRLRLRDDRPLRFFGPACTSDDPARRSNPVR